MSKIIIFTLIIINAGVTLGYKSGQYLCFSSKIPGHQVGREVCCKWEVIKVHPRASAAYVIDRASSSVSVEERTLHPAVKYPLIQSYSQVTPGPHGKYEYP